MMLPYRLVVWRVTRRRLAMHPRHTVVWDASYRYREPALADMSKYHLVRGYTYCLYDYSERYGVHDDRASSVEDLYEDEAEQEYERYMRDKYKDDNLPF